MDPVAAATFMLAGVTALLAGFNLVLTLETRDLAKATRDLVKAAQEQLQISKDELKHLQAEATAAQQPEVALEVSNTTIQPERQGPDLNLFYIWVQLRISNYGGHAVVEPLQVTGRPQVETRPRDVAGFLPSGGSLPFRIRFDVGNAAENLDAVANVPIRARGVRQTDWRSWLFFVTVGYSLERGWYVDIRQPAMSG